MSSDRNQSRRAAHKLHAARRVLLHRYPYHGSILSSDRFIEDPTIGTMAVTAAGGKVTYYYSPSFVLEKCSDEELQGVIHHEINHWLFRHVYLDPEEFPDRRARTIAAEVTVNEFVTEPLPGKPIRLSDFPDLPPRESTAARYHRLAGREDLPGGFVVDNHVTWDPDAKQSPLEQQIEEALRRTRRRGADVSREMFRRFWGVGDGNAARREQLRLRGGPQKPIDWSRVLRAAIGSSARQHANFSRPPRRLPHLVGVVPADEIQPKRPRVLTVIDTSGSMDGEALARVAAELKQIRRFAKVVVVECDKTIRARYPFRSALKEVHGRGGTDLRPALEPEFLRKERPHVVIYFTDGNGPTAPDPPRVPVVWCLTPAGERPARWGREVRMAA